MTKYHTIALIGFAALMLSIIGFLESIMVTKICAKNPEATRCL